MSNDTGREPVEGTWRGSVRWSCPFCQFDAIGDRGTLVSHIAQIHPPFEDVSALETHADRETKPEIPVKTVSVAGVKATTKGAK